jgi:hypothetical protein
VRLAQIFNQKKKNPRPAGADHGLRLGLTLAGQLRLNPSSSLAAQSIA